MVFGWVGLGSLRVMEGLCSREGCPDGLKVYLFSLSGSVLVLSLVKIGGGRGGPGRRGLSRSLQLGRSQVRKNSSS